ncbi:HAD family hydrolase [Acidipropionibacterium jensenii]|uniref:HAD family phosphatase n=1 Tax=Acidipropionibacterium jensenii TaxID=1749 RepID=A0A3Q9UHX8_9ACTN|nr:HAD family hydrolase [Acidipropionibacterium jensenii]AZZ38577.1 HAD family phosphatase [Acidipropionibacterium jensenii]MDN5977560.1 Cof-type HAD-IIB family hydrolase [Acidipropionibacterium jensenii]MDN6426812.1 Cof-type HAD-IIB family hydrolase [Acidipropionibacterium jensenii]MDN6440868.1 Cof-type HAD-IIB family hydrolase [Acidipropionibacterium jensenii]MDN6512201.1 Cof-type HAD-IIB family hydrolase [Acidipropionibacterium jensenii]
MSFTPHLVALDIDGTLVDRQGLLPTSIEHSVERITGAGVPVVLATGRGLFGALPVHDILRLPAGDLVVSNGAVTVSTSPLTVLDEVRFDPGPVIRQVLDLHPSAIIAVEDVGVGYRLNRLFPAGELQGEFTIESTEELASRPAARVIIRDPDAPPADFVELARHLGLHGVSYVIGWSAWLDITPRGVSKASALQALCDRRDIDPRQVLAIGDGHNDMEMLAWAGRGVAMGDAPESVQQVANAVTGTFDEGGTSAELDRWFAGPR